MMTMAKIAYLQQKNPFFTNDDCQTKYPQVSIWWNRDKLESHLGIFGVRNDAECFFFCFVFKTSCRNYILN